MFLWVIPFTNMALLWTTLAVTLLGIWSGGRVERVLHEKDPGIIVIDEVAGMALSVLSFAGPSRCCLVAFFSSVSSMCGSPSRLTEPVADGRPSESCGRLIAGV